MLQTNPRFMTKLLEQLGGCAAIRAEFLKASQDARCKEGIRGLTSLEAVFSRPLVQTDPTRPNFDFHFLLNEFGLKQT